MKTCLAIVLYTLSLFGIDVGSHIRIDRVRGNGTDALYSKVVAQPGSTRFECVQSDSGQCYYTVFHDNASADCLTGRAAGMPPARCMRETERFAVANGESRQVERMSTLHMCVGTQASMAAADCR